MEIDNLKAKAIDLQMESHDDLVGSVKLYFSFSTGAAVLLVNASAQPNTLTPGWQFACLSALALGAFAFTIAAIRAMRSTIYFSRIKSSIARSLGAGDETVGKIGDACCPFLRRRSTTSSQS
jgi:hypothetical protein